MNDFREDWNQGNRSELARAFYRHGILKNDWADLDLVLDPDPNDKKADAVDLPYGGEGKLMMIRGEDDWFYVDLDRGEEVNVSVTTGAPGLLDLEAIGPGSSVIAGSSTSGIAYSSISFTASEAGRYYVKVHPASFSPRNSVPYELDWGWDAAPQPDSFEQNDRFGTASTRGRTLPSGCTTQERTSWRRGRAVAANSRST
jgi:hypothetical protein